MPDEPDIFDAYNAYVGGDAPYSHNVRKGHRGVPPEFADASAARRTARAAKDAAEMGPVITRADRVVRGSEMAAGKVSGLMGKALKFLGHPAVVAGMFAPDAVKLLSKMTRAARQAHEQDIYINQLLEVGVEERRRRRDQYVQQQRRGMLRDENARRLAQFAPHLYNQVMAGKKLPRDAVVVGGTPRTDLLDELAQSMADGAWENG